jgi:hypothetical protein
MENSRRLNYPQLKSERARRILEAPEPSWAKRHPLLSTAIFTGALIVSSLFISKYAKPSEEKVDSDSARVSVSANASNASKTKDRWEQLKNLLKVRKELKGKMPRGSPDEENESVLSAEEIKQKLFSMNAAEFDEYRQGLEDELEDVKERMGELDSLWPNMSEAQWEELAQLRKRSEELEASRWIATQENIGRGTELVLANEIEWEDQGKLLDWRREYLGMRLDGWRGQELQGDNEDYVNRMLVVLNWAIDARKQGYEPLRADLLFFRPDYVN